MKFRSMLWYGCIKVMVFDYDVVCWCCFDEVFDYFVYVGVDVICVGIVDDECGVIWYLC